MKAFMQDGVMVMQCVWFATCTNGTLKAAEHPTLGPVPICLRCAGKSEVTELLDIELTVQ